MRFGIVRDLIAHARREDEDSTILQFGVQFPFQAKQHMPL